MAASPPIALIAVTVASSSNEMQSHSTLPSGVRINSARCPMAKVGTVPMPIRFSSCCTKVLA
jgi:hypothetical protein